MKPRLLPLLALVALSPAAVSAQGPAALVAGRVAGTVTTVNAATRTLTVTPRLAPAPVTFTLAPAAPVIRLAPAALSDLRAAQAVQITGQADAGGGTVSATRITILPLLPKRAGERAGGRAVVGTVATTTPALTVTTPAGKVVTVTTSPATRVERAVAGAFSDLAVGENVQARLSGDAPNQVASLVTILPARPVRPARPARRARRATASVI